MSLAATSGSSFHSASLPAGVQRHALTARFLGSTLAAGAYPVGAGGGVGSGRVLCLAAQPGNSVATGRGGGRLSRQGILAWAWLGVVLWGWGGLAPLGAEEDPRSDPAYQKAREAKGREALRQFRALAERYPGSALVQYELGEALFVEQEYAQALQCYAKVRALGVDSARLACQIGKCHSSLKEYALAESAYRGALASSPEDRRIQFGLAAALFEQKKYEEALVLFKPLQGEAGEWGVSAREYLAIIVYSLGRYQEALGHLKPLVEAAPADAYLRWLLAISHYQLGEYEDALGHFEKVAAGDKSYAEAARFYRAACLEGVGRGREAEWEYRALSGRDSDWSKAAHTAAGSLSGRPLRVFLDLSGGYDTGLVRPGDAEFFVGGKDYFSQQFLLLEGRVLHTPDLDLWLSGEHYGLHYPELNDNDYFQEKGKVSFRMPTVGPFFLLQCEYGFRYAQLDYQSYVRGHEGRLEASYRDRQSRLRFGLGVEAKDYFRESEVLTGPDFSFELDYRRALPCWEHFLQVRVNLNYQQTQLERLEHFTQRLRLRYGAKLIGGLSAYLEGSYRRDDYPNSQGVLGGTAFNHRTDHRLSGEVRLEYQLRQFLSLNLGYLYESQDSRRENQEYGRHQVDAGITISF